MAPPQCTRPGDERPEGVCLNCGQNRSVRGNLCVRCDAEIIDDAEDWRDVYDRESCWHCLGAGGFHDCGEDCCPCLEPELNETCPECNGKGWL